MIVTVVDGRGHNYISNTRVYMPLGLGWLAVCCFLLSNASKKDALWGAALASILIPILFSFVFFFIRGATGEAFAAMPRSMTAWIEYDPEQDGKLARQDVEHASFLANLVKRRGKVPDLFVAPEGRFITELRVPCFWTFIATRNDGHIYYSTKKIEVWAMVPLDEEDVLVRKFGKAFSRERIDAPDGYPYVTYIFEYDPGSE